MVRRKATTTPVTARQSVEAKSVVSDVAGAGVTAAVDEVKAQLTGEFNEAKERLEKKAKELESNLRSAEAAISEANRKWPDGARWIIGIAAIGVFLAGLLLGKAL